MQSSLNVHPTAVVDEGAVIGEGTAIWHFSHICSGAVIGKNCSLGQNVLVADCASLGNNVKVQNNVAIYGGITVEDDVFLGPSCVLTNVTNPRSQVSRQSLYEKTFIKRGSSIGANATIVCGITLGRYSFVGAGAVVTKDIPDYGLVLGNPGKLSGYMSRHGHKLIFDQSGRATCLESNFVYEKVEEQVRCLDLGEDDPLPIELSVGSHSYDSLKKYMPVALITGITGQDGSYLTELLLEKGYSVHGIVRRSSSMNRWRIDHLVKDENIYGNSLFLHYADLSDDASLRRIFSKVSPDEVYHLAGQSHVALSFEIPELSTHEIANATLKLLEISRDQTIPPKIYLAGSSEIFGHAQEPIQTEETQVNPTSPYGVCKTFCVQMGKVYRSGYGMHVSNGILYNHESPRRGENFVTQKIVRGAALIAQGKAEFLELGNLDNERDWGYAPEYVRGMWMMLQEEKADDYILATGKTHSLSDFLTYAFQYFNLDYENYVRVNPKFIRPSEPQKLCGNPSKAISKLGWKTTYKFEEIVYEMCEASSAKLSKNL
jgi:GDPmannose 4,6-dehydratase